MLLIIQIDRFRLIWMTYVTVPHMEKGRIFCWPGLLLEWCTGTEISPGGPEFIYISSHCALSRYLCARALGVFTAERERAGASRHDAQKPRGYACRPYAVVRLRPTPVYHALP